MQWLQSYNSDVTHRSSRSCLPPLWSGYAHGGFDLQRPFERNKGSGFVLASARLQLLLKRPEARPDPGGRESNLPAVVLCVSTITGFAGRLLVNLRLEAAGDDDQKCWPGLGMLLRSGGAKLVLSFYGAMSQLGTVCTPVSPDAVTFAPSHPSSPHSTQAASPA